MSHDGRRLVAVAATLALAVGGILAAILALGHVTLTRMLIGDALATAELWSRSVLGDGPADVRDKLAAAGDEAVKRTLAIAGIDRLVLVPESGSPISLQGSGGGDELKGIAAPGSAAPLFSAESGVYTRDTLRWFGQGEFRSWVLFQPPAEGGARLAARVDQTLTANDLVQSFMREVLFSGGVAAITFASFMAGFSYRQRQLAAENTAIRYLALHDELTGLPNRKQFEEFMSDTIAAAEQEGTKAALFVLDLDDFKAVNDTLGHPVGDGLLKAAAMRLKGSLRTGDLLARLSGDEFAIVVPKVADPAMLAPLAQRVLHLLSSPFRVDGHEIQVGCSIGLAVAPDNGAETGTLMRNADFALYRAKSEGRRTWRFFDPKMAEDLASRRTLEDGLRHALENDHFQLLYQPQIALATGQTVGYEAMLRWRLPGRGLVPASVFVSIAEETGLVVPIGEWVIRQVARDCALIPADRRVGINLSATQLKRDGIESFILETLKSHKIAPGRIEIEVNETILGRNETLAFQRLEKIRDAGVRIVMDSFGVGTLSLGLLSRYSFDKIKVDRTFLMNDEQKSGAVLAAICSLGRSLGFRVAGQGVETVEHAQLLRAAGCSEAQGYYFAPPMPLESLLQMEQERAAPKLAAIA
ncbi:MAG TPA: EAL domain-containing protein [Propylenella sp.]